MFLSKWREFPSAPCLVGKETLWQLSTRYCWYRARPWHASELVSFLVGLRTYQRPGICTYVFIWSTRYACQILMKHEFAAHIFEKSSDIKFHDKIRPVGAEFVARGWMRIDPFSSCFANAPKKALPRVFCVLHVQSKNRTSLLENLPLVNCFLAWYSDTSANEWPY